MSIKAVFVDFDFTLYSHRKKHIPQSAVDALMKIHEKGLKTVLATGRNVLEMELFSEYRDIPFDGFVMLNGQLCLDSSMKKIFANQFRGEALDSVVSLFNEKEVPMAFVEENSIYINFCSEVINIASGDVATLRYEPGVYCGNPLYLAVAYADESQEADILARLPGCNFKRWGHIGIDIVPEGMDKTKGVQLFLDRFGVSREECFAIGDSFNDVGMIDFAGTGVAMGNAVSEAKAVADYVTDDIDDDGLAHAFEHYGLI
ncbi:MAG: Cof-type HAD-IIB family hydrolase [Sphaerochaetaceae bacterium]|nr:Cof-type HAD-IIB family hydrolase [Sphaerochaetaceae bacterium]